MKTLILGKRSILTKSLKSTIKDSVVLSSEDILKKKNYLLPNKFNFIINLFYSSKKLNKIKNYNEYFNYTIFYLSNFLQNINKKKINKVIYTSSSSIYGEITEDGNKRNLYASSKLLVENYLKNLNFLKKKLIIARLYNIYERNENFSFINKIIEFKKNNKKILLFNQGLGIRDFIKISDVAKIYKNLLNKKYYGTIDVGTGYGIQIKNLVDAADLKYKNINGSKEQKISIANTQALKNILPKLKFFNLEQYFKKNNIKLRSKINKLRLPSEKKNQINENITVIYGAGFAGKKLYDQIKSSNAKINIFFVDDDLKKQNKYYKNSQIISFEKHIDRLGCLVDDILEE